MRTPGFHALLLISSWYIEGALGRKGGGGMGGIDDFHALDFESPKFTAAFALTIVTAIFTFYQLTIVISRYRKPGVRESSPRILYQVGILFPILLTLYIISFLVWTILYAIFLAFRFARRYELNLLASYVPGMLFVEQVANVLFVAMLLQIIAYRLRIQLNPLQSQFNTKAVIDGLLLSFVGILGLAMVGVKALYTSYPAQDAIFPAIRLANAVFIFICYLNISATAITAHTCLENSNCDDNIVRVAAYWVSPFVMISGIYRVLESGLYMRGIRYGAIFQDLIVADAVIFGVVSLAVTGLALTMGRLPKLPSTTGTKNFR